MLRRVREQGDVAGALERDRQLALVAGAGAGLASRLDLGPLRQVAAEAVDLLVVDLDGLVGAERADLAATSIAVEVVALLGSDGGASVGGLLIRREGRRGRCRRQAGRAGAATRRTAGRGTGRRRQPGRRRTRRRRRDRLRSRLMTLSAVTSSDVRFWPSLPSNSRVLKRPSTKTRLPLRSCSAARSARSPKTLTRNQSVPSSTQPPCPSGLLWLTATLNWVTGWPFGRVAHLRVAPEVADDHDLAERHRRASVSRWRPGPPRSRTRR